MLTGGEVLDIILVSVMSKVRFTGLIAGTLAALRKIVTKAWSVVLEKPAVEVLAAAKSIVTKPLLLVTELTGNDQSGEESKGGAG